MNDLFADWHRDISIDLAGVDLPGREEAADSIARDADRERVASLVAIAIGKSASENGEPSIRRIFKDSEQAFAMRGNALELRMLCSAVLEAICQRNDDIAIMASYAILLADHRGLKIPLKETVDAASICIRDSAVERRIVPDRPILRRISPLNDSLKEKINAVGESSNYATPVATSEAIMEVAKALQQSVSAINKTYDAIMDWTKKKIEVSAEESDMLWWLLSGASATLDMRWSDMPLDTLAVVAGRELSEIVVILPAPAQCSELLEQIIAAHESNKSPLEDNTIPIGAVENPEPLKFLYEDCAESSGNLDDSVNARDLAKTSFAQSLLTRAWNALS